MKISWSIPEGGGAGQKSGSYVECVISYYWYVILQLPHSGRVTIVIFGTTRLVEILLVEDSPIDIKLTEEALLEGKVKNNLHVVQDGEDAMDFLRKKGKYNQAPTPDLVLLDLNLPRKDGREVLAEMKSDLVLRRIPVVILTTSRAEEDIIKTYDLHVNCYVTKPVDMNQFLEVIKSISNFWLTVVVQPEKNS